MSNKYDWELQWKNKRGWDGWDKKQSAWRPAEGKCKVCKEDYIRHRRISRSSNTEYDHGTWVCIDEYTKPKDIF